MYKQNSIQKTGLIVNKSADGESIEQKVERIVSNKEQVTDSMPMMYTERKDGVIAGMNIRTDRFEIAIEASEKIAKSYRARREAGIESRNPKVIQLDGGNESAESTQGTK